MCASVTDSEMACRFKTGSHCSPVNFSTFSVSHFTVWIELVPCVLYKMRLCYGSLDLVLPILLNNSVDFVVDLGCST